MPYKSSTRKHPNAKNTGRPNHGSPSTKSRILQECDGTKAISKTRSVQAVPHFTYISPLPCPLLQLQAEHTAGGQNYFLLLTTRTCPTSKVPRNSCTLGCYITVACITFHSYKESIHSFSIKLICLPLFW